jgi:hypothetical protein
LTLSGAFFAILAVSRESGNRALMRKPYLELALSGTASCMLYGLLYVYEREILQTFTRTDGLYPLLSVIAALVFSFVHGAFASYFWDVLGITARSGKSRDG